MADAPRGQKQNRRLNFMPGSHLAVENLNVYYGAQHALKDVTVEIPDRQVTAIIGPSGCGKSSLLKSFNRLIDLTEGTRVTGRVIVDGIDIMSPGTDLAAVRKKMGLLSQTPWPLPMSIFENVAYGPRIHGMTNRKQLRETVEIYLKKAGLWDEVKARLSRPADGLSKGQQQRLALARGLAVGPEVILADEATSALDPVSAKRIEQLFIELKSEYSVVLVTHILRQARRIADYVLFLYMGELVEHGPAAQIFGSPSDPRTQAYVRGDIS
jgi:phosphate transport system ATP-binding protein